MIKWLTSNPAKALALGDRIGRLVPGFDADACFGRAIRFSIYSKPEKVFIDGALVFDSGLPKTSVRFELGRTITSTQQ